jgi:hypothetical protein
MVPSELLLANITTVRMETKRMHVGRMTTEHGEAASTGYQIAGGMEADGEDHICMTLERGGLTISAIMRVSTIWICGALPGVYRMILLKRIQKAKYPVIYARSSLYCVGLARCGPVSLLESPHDPVECQCELQHRCRRTGSPAQALGVMP